MRADRLLTIALLRQRRGRLSVAELADRLEVSQRTILRDMTALGTAGIPVLSIRGPGGGFELVPGSYAELVAFTDEESAVLTLIGQPAAAMALGFETARAHLHLKLELLLSKSGRRSSAELRARFLLDEEETDPATGEIVAFLRKSTWMQRVVLVRLDGAVERTIEPLGLVFSGGEWFVAAREATDIDIIRVSSIVGVTNSGARFERPLAFDLKQTWREWQRSNLAVRPTQRRTVATDTS